MPKGVSRSALIELACLVYPANVEHQETIGWEESERSWTREVKIMVCCLFIVRLQLCWRSKLATEEEFRPHSSDQLGEAILHLHGGR